MYHRLLVIVFVGVALAGSISAQFLGIADLDKWRQNQADELLKDDGWLTVAGLFWLKEGVNTVGSGAGFDVELTSRFKGPKFGEITLGGGHVRLTLAGGVQAMADGTPIVSPLELVSDEKGKPTHVTIGSQTFYVIKREDRLGVRLKDTQNPPRTGFKGLEWFPEDARYRVTAQLTAYPAPKEISVPNVLGGTFKMQSPGILHFTLRGREYTLEPTIEDDHLFIIFRDLTSRTDTYGAGRFLYAPMPKDGKVVLDFNRAENPPSAFTSFATCPLPPQQNRLNVAITAGEKRYSP